jgi:small subunit ribosomal protein S7
MGIAQAPSVPTPAVHMPPANTQDTYLAIPPADDPLLAYLASRLMNNGHRARASRQASRVLLHLHAFTRAPALPILREALHAAAPAVRTISTRRGAKQIFRPVALGEKQRMWYALTWIMDASVNRNGQTVEERIARELIAILQGESSVLKKKEEVHKFAMVNRYVRHLALEDGTHGALEVPQWRSDCSFISYNLEPNNTSCIHLMTCSDPPLAVFAIFGLVGLQQSPWTY